MGDRSGMSIFADSPSDETLNRGPLALLLRRQYEFRFVIDIVQFSILSIFFLRSIKVGYRIPIVFVSKSTSHFSSSIQSLEILIPLIRNTTISDQ